MTSSAHGGPEQSVAVLDRPSPPAGEDTVAQPALPALDEAGSRGVFRRPLTWVSLLTMFVVWQVISLVAGDNTSGDRLVPGIVDVAGASSAFADYWRGGLGVETTRTGGPVTLEGALLGFAYNSMLTTLRAVGGIGLGIVAGIGFAVLVSWSRLLREAFLLPGHFARMLPLLAMVPLFTLWFGASEFGAVLFIAFTVFVILFVITLNAIGSVPPHFAQYARSLGAGRVRTYLEVVLPGTLPQLKGAILLSLGFAWSAAIAAEYLGQQFGLGAMVKTADFFGRTDLLALVALIVVIYAGISYMLATKLLNWITRWAE